MAEELKVSPDEEKEAIVVYKDNLDELQQLYDNLGKDHKKQYQEYEQDHQKWLNIHGTMKKHIEVLTEQLASLKIKYVEVTKRLRELKKTEGKLKEVEEENARLKEALKALLKQINDTNNLLNNNPYPNFLEFLANMNKKLKDQEDKWKKEKDKMQEELARLLKMLDERYTEFEQIIEEREREIDKLKKENEDLKKQIEERDELIKNLQLEKGRLESREKANAMVQNATDDDKDKIIKELQEYKDTKGIPAEKEAENLAKELEQKNNDYDELLRKLREKEEELKDKDEELREKDERYKELEEKMNDMKDNYERVLEDKNDEIRELNSDIDDKNAEIERLREALRKANRELEERDNEKDHFIPMEMEDLSKKDQSGLAVRMMEELGLVCAIYILVCCVFVSWGLLVPGCNSFINNWITYECLQPTCIDKSISTGSLIISMLILAFFAVLIFILFVLLSLWKKAKRWTDIKKLELPSLFAFIITSCVWIWWCFQVGIVYSTFGTTISATPEGANCGDGTTDTTTLFEDASAMKKNALVALVIGVVPLFIILCFVLVCWRRFGANNIYIDKY